jgi:hypothetical protein
MWLIGRSALEPPSGQSVRVSSGALDLSKAWWTVLVPGSTYSRVPLERLPELPDHLSTSLSWLASLPALATGHGVLRPDQAQRPLSPDLGPWLVAQGVPAQLLPEPLTQLASRPELLAGVRSVTDCYVDVGDHAVQVDDAAGGGWLVRFLTDSQAVLSWLIHISPSGSHSIVVTPAWIGWDTAPDPDEEYPIPDRPLRRGDLHDLEVEVCAGSLIEFLARFWLENETWHALHGARSSGDVRHYRDEWIRLNA